MNGFQTNCGAIFWRVGVEFDGNSYARVTIDSKQGARMKTKIIIAALLITFGANAAYAQRVTRVNSDPESVMSDEQKLGPNVRTYRRGNAVITTGTGWYGSRAYRRHAKR